MNREPLAFLNRYAMLRASLTLTGLALIVLIFRSRDLGLPAIILAVMLLMLQHFSCSSS